MFNQTIAFNFFKWDIEIHLRARRTWFEFRVFKGDGTTHLVWGKLSIHAEDATDAHYAVCAECQSDEVGEVHFGDEGLTVCQSCQSVEAGYQYLTKREFERAN